MVKDRLTKQERSWILYDCANSAYSIAITTALLPIVFGMFDNVNSSMSLGYFNSIASIIIAILSPILGTLADYKRQKEEILPVLFYNRSNFYCSTGICPAGKRFMAASDSLLCFDGSRFCRC